MEKNNKKKSPVKEAFEVLRENYSPESVQEFTEKYNSFPAQIVLDEAKYIFTVNEASSEFFNNFCKVNAKLFSRKELVDKYEEVYEVLNRAVEKDIHIGPHFDSMLNIKETLEDEIKRRSYDRNCLEESYKVSLEEECLLKERDKKIFNSIKINPGNVTNDIIRIESLVESFSKNFSNANMLVTKLIPAAAIVVKNYPEYLTEGSSLVNIGDTLKSLLPNNEKNIVRYAKIIESTILDVPENDFIPKIFKEKLMDNMAIFHQAAYNVIYKPEPTGVIESITMEKANEEEILEDLLVESIINIGINEEITEEDFKENLDTLYRCSKRLGIIEEAANVKRGPKSTVHKISTKVEKGARSFANNARDRYENKQRSMAGIQKAKEHIEKAINYPIKKFLEQDKEARKKRVIQGGFRAQIWKWLSIAIKSGLVGFAVNPLAGAITAIGLATIDKSVDLKTKRQVLKELETEIKLCEEKIDDAKAEAQKQEKYKLMRIKAKLENEYERIKYNLGPK